MEPEFFKSKGKVVISGCRCFTPFVNPSAGPVSTTMGPDNSEMAHERTAIEEQIKEIDECITRLSSYLNDKVCLLL